MSVFARGLLYRSTFLSLRELTGCRFVSSKRMVESPGTGCCSAGESGKGCFDKAKKEEKKKNEEKKPMGPPKKQIPMECMGDPCCPDPPRRYDEQFKKQLVHKERKKFQRTWVECPPRRVVQKVICGAPEPEPEPDCKPKKKCPPPPPEKCDELTGKCPKITMPGCRAAKVKICKKFPKPSNCEKIKAPYPAFSECRKPLPKPLPPNECDCHVMRGFCEIITNYKKKGLLDKMKAEGKLQ